MALALIMLSLYFFYNKVFWLEIALYFELSSNPESLSPHNYGGSMNSNPILIRFVNGHQGNLAIKIYVTWLDSHSRQT
jgi:hypothetical protein